MVLSPCVRPTVRDPASRLPRGAPGAPEAGGRVTKNPAIARRVLWIQGWPCGPVLCATRSEAVTAVDRLRAAGSERDLGLAAATRARGREHLARAGGVPTAASAAAVGPAAEVTALGLAGCAAGGATARFAELAICVELLLTRTEDEFLVAVLANQGLVRCVQRTLLDSCGLSDTSVSPRTVERSDRVSRCFRGLLARRAEGTTYASVFVQ